MILTDIQIRERVLHSTTPLIEDFTEESLQSESYDISVGNKISKYNASFKIIDLDEQKIIDNAYIQEDIPEDGYIIGPKEFVLIQVKERINMPNDLTAHIRPRTKFTRMGLLVSAQHCNSSYRGYLNLGLFNANPFGIKIEKNMKLAQIVFEELKSIPSKNKKYNGTYQNENNGKGADFTTEDHFVSANSRIVLTPEARSIYDILRKGINDEN